MKASELRDLEDGELRKRVAELAKEAFGLRFANATGELDDTAGIARAKRDLARALTVQRERELTPSPPAPRTRRSKPTTTTTDG